MIHINLAVEANSHDILKSYLIARLIHKNLQVSKETAVTMAEREYETINYEDDIAAPLLNAGWKLDYIYVDEKM